MDYLAEKKRRLEISIRENNTKDTIQLLHDLAVAYARNKDYEKAEQYRDKLNDIDPSALSEIIQINEIIEEQKTEGIYIDHKGLFSDLYDQLTEEEGNVLFDALKEMKVPIDTAIFRQGDSNSALYFVNQGKLRIAIKRGERNSFVKILNAGDIFGYETFFSSSICTSSIIAFVSTTLYRLDKDDFQNLQRKYPDLEAKLKGYCIHVGTVTGHVQKKKMDRRQKKREGISGKAVIQFLSSSDNLIGKPIRVELIDISNGGTSFLIRLSNEEKTDTLLGRKLVIQYSSSAVSPPIKIQAKGTIVAINPKAIDEYSFHLKFDKNLTGKSFAAILSIFGTAP